MLLRPISTAERLSQRQHFSRKKRYSHDQYQSLLSEFLDTHECLTLAEYVAADSLNGRRILLLRHDIDHDFETALQMACWEQARGVRSTYAVLHTAWYYGEFLDGHYVHTEELVDLCGRLTEMGHEVILHNNLATLALETGADPADVLHEELAFLRGLGLCVLGTATHGDRLCRTLGFGNFEIFAEAVKPERGGARTLTTERGKVHLGSLSYAEFGLLYEAYDIHRDLYISDSGGNLRCTRHAAGRFPFGRTAPETGEVVGILAHPVWWDFSGTEQPDSMMLAASAR